MGALCPDCGASLGSGTKFCTACGRTVQTRPEPRTVRTDAEGGTCSSCGRGFTVRQRFCVGCGTPLPTVPSLPSLTKAVAEVEPKVAAEVGSQLAASTHPTAHVGEATRGGAASVPVCAHCGSQGLRGWEYCSCCGQSLAAVLVDVHASNAVVPSADVTPDTGLTASGPELVIGPFSDSSFGRPSRKMIRGLIVTACVLVLLVAGLVVKWALTPTPSSTVEDYLNAISDGEAEKALSYVRADTISGPLLTDAALTDPDNRPREITILTTSEGTTYTGERVTTVSARYQVRETTVDQTFSVLWDGNDWRIADPFVGLTVEDPGNRELTLNSVSVPHGQQLAAFPGAYTLSAAATPLYSAAETTVTPTGTGGGAQAWAGLGDPNVSEAAQETIGQALADHLETCVQSTSAEPPNCGFRTGYIPGQDIQVRWEVTTRPTWHLSEGWDGDMVISESAYGLARYDATYTDYAGVRQSASDNVTFGIDARVRIIDDRLVVTFE